MVKKKILIIKPSSLGDIVHAMPSLPALKELYPDSEISWLIGLEYSELLSGNPLINNLFIFDRGAWNRNIFTAVKKFLRLVADLRRQKFDIIFDWQGLFRSGVIAFLSGAPQRICFKYTREGSRFFYTKRLGTDKIDIHAIDRMLSVLESLGWQKKVITKEDFFFSLPQTTERKIKEALNKVLLERKKIVVLNPFTKWGTKQWNLDNYVALGEMLGKKEGIQIVLSGSLVNQKEGEKFLNMKCKPINLIGKTSLVDLVALLKKTELLVASDSGPIHLANALGVKTVTLFGPTDHKRTGAYLEGNVVVCKELDCAPCFKKYCEDPICMKEIEVEKVFKAVTTVLDN